MKILEISELVLNTHEKDYSNLANAMADLNWNSIQESAWEEEYPYTPKAEFQIGYDASHIYLHYNIQEDFVKAAYMRPNENVWEDSCVEFFISFDEKKTYFNIEFNILGTGLIGYGPATKSERSRLSASEILSVQTFTNIQSVHAQKNWQEILIIPIALFSMDENSLKASKAHANFYKCGDGLPSPHFISWNKINHPTPNFHLPEFFGEIRFI